MCPEMKDCLRQALLNLVRTAAEACATAPAGGTVLPSTGELVFSREDGRLAADFRF